MSLSETWDFTKAVEKLAQDKSALASLTETELVAKTVAAEGDLVRLRKTAERAARESMLAVLLAGYALQELKKTPREKGWVAFMDEHLATMSRASIYRYLRVAEQYPDPKGLPKDLSIMDAYRLCGLIKEKDNPAKKGAPDASATDPDTPPPPPAGEDFPDRIRGMARFFEAFDAGQVVASIEPDRRHALADEVGKLMIVLGKIHAALTKA